MKRIIVPPEMKLPKEERERIKGEFLTRDYVACVIADREDAKEEKRRRSLKPEPPAPWTPTGEMMNVIKVSREGNWCVFPVDRLDDVLEEIRCSADSAAYGGSEVLTLTFAQMDKAEYESLGEFQGW